MPTPYKSETESQFLKRCLASPGLDRGKCKRKWTESKQSKGKNSMRSIQITEFSEGPSNADLEKIRQDAGNPNLSA